jgi:transcriptional regulator with XRE-family HTH domain
MTINDTEQNALLAHSMSVEEQSKRIRTLREDLGFSNRSLSKQTGISEQELSKYVHGKVKSIAARHIVKLALAFGVTTDYLLYGNSANVNPETAKRIILERYMGRYIDGFAR